MESCMGFPHPKMPWFSRFSGPTSSSHSEVHKRIDVGSQVQKTQFLVLSINRDGWIQFADNIYLYIYIYIYSPCSVMGVLNLFGSKYPFQLLIFLSTRLWYPFPFSTEAITTQRSLEQLILGYIPKIAASLGKCSPPFWDVGVFENREIFTPLKRPYFKYRNLSDLKGQTH